MKVSHYIIILVLSIMTAGLISSTLIYFQSVQIHKNQEEFQQLVNKKTLIKDTKNRVSKFLNTLNLYLTNQQTYLFYSLNEEANSILEILNKIPVEYQSQVDGLSKRIQKIIEICSKCKSSDEDADHWRIAIEESDSFASNIETPFKVIENGLIKETDQKEIKVFLLKERQLITVLLIMIFIVLVTIFMITWSNKILVAPIEKLSSLASKEDISANDFKLQGPVEIKSLAEKFGNFILALLKARKLAEEESKLSRFANARVRNIMETAGDAILCTNAKGEIYEMNQSFRNLSRININKYPQPTLKDFIPDLELEEFDNDESCMLISFIEATLYTRNGDDIPVEISTSSFSSNKERLFTIIIRDITDRKELLEQLLQAQKLESIGRLAAGIAHEINTPAQYIMDYNRFIKDAFLNLKVFIEKAHKMKIPELENLTEEMGLDFYEEEVPNAINGSLFGLEQISKIIKSVKGFTHPNNTEKTVYSINNIVKDTINVSRNEWKYDCEIDLNLNEEILPIECYPVRMNQVILNLVINSAQSIHEKISDNDKLDKGKIVISTDQDESNVYIKVRDNGTGIPDNIKSKIFDPFFTTKEVGVGTGQGLALSYDFIVKKHNGEITFESTVGEGTEFCIRIPKSLEFKKAV